MDNLLETFRNQQIVEKYIELRRYILNNKACYEVLKNKLSHNDAKYSSPRHEIIIEEYLELMDAIKNDLKIIKSILGNGINEDFAE